VIADDHPIFRFGLRRLLDTDPAFGVVGEAVDGVTALEAVRETSPDVLLLDLAMPRLGGLESLARLDSPIRVIVLTAAATKRATAQALQLGARAVVLKETATRNLLETIRQVMRGQYVVDGGAVGDLAAALTSVERTAKARHYGLTDRECEIVAAIAMGQSNRDIAQALRISTQTVKHNLTNIFDKTGVSSRLALALLAIRGGLIEE
jgi:DNA-binding NarL/FixJ family response regulator